MVWESPIVFFQVILQFPLVGENGANRAAKEGRESAGHNKNFFLFFSKIGIFKSNLLIRWGFPPVTPLPLPDCRVEQLFNLVARLNFLDGTWMSNYFIVVRQLIHSRETSFFQRNRIKSLSFLASLVSRDMLKGILFLLSDEHSYPQDPLQRGKRGQGSAHTCLVLFGQYENLGPRIFEEPSKKTIKISIPPGR